MSFQPPQRVLMGPGPSDVHPRILSALARPTVGHLDPSFIQLMDEIKALPVLLSNNQRAHLTCFGSGLSGHGNLLCQFN